MKKYLVNLFVLGILSYFFLYVNVTPAYAADCSGNLIDEILCVTNNAAQGVVTVVKNYLNCSGDNNSNLGCPGYVVPTTPVAAPAQPAPVSPPAQPLINCEQDPGLSGCPKPIPPAVPLINCETDLGAPGCPKLTPACIPQCSGDLCGQKDGCGGSCPNNDIITLGKCGNPQAPSKPGGSTGGSPTQTPTPTRACNWAFLRNECTGCGKAQSVEQDCNGNTRISAQNVSDQGCSAASRPDLCPATSPKPTPASEGSPSKSSPAPAAVRAVSYLLSEKPFVNNVTTLTAGSEVSFPTSVPFHFSDSTAGTKTVFVRFFYSDGTHKDSQKSIIYTPLVKAPAPALARCLGTCADENGKVGNQTCTGWYSAGDAWCKANTSNWHCWSNCTATPAQGVTTCSGTCADSAGNGPNGVKCTDWIRGSFKNCTDTGVYAYCYRSSSCQ